MDEGRTTSTFRAHRIADDKPVTARFFFPGPGRRLNGTEKRVHREAEALIKLSHPGIVTGLDFHPGPDGVLIITEAIGGTPLADLLKQRGRFPHNEATAIIQKICEAMNVLEEQNILHRDIRPKNLFTTDDQRIILANFDLIPYVDLLHKKAEDWPVTPGWNLAPEQLTNGRTDHRTDIFGLGATYFQLVTGQAPFEPTKDPAALKKRIAAAPDPRTHYPATPAGVAKVIMKMMAPKPKYRYSNQKELAWDLEYASNLTE